MSVRRWAAAAAVAIAGLSGTVDAAAASGDRVLRDFGACRAMVDPAQRLACFERTLDGFEHAVRSKEVTIVDKADVREAKRSLFGFALPRIDLFGGGRSDPAEEFVEINTTVASAREIGSGRAEIRLADANGATWQTTDPMNFPPRPGDKIRIRQGALGNYFLSVGGRSYRGQRTR